MSGATDVSLLGSYGSLAFSFLSVLQGRTGISVLYMFYDLLLIPVSGLASYARPRTCFLELLPAIAGFYQPCSL
jgi:hypothetical protein